MAVKMKYGHFTWILVAVYCLKVGVLDGANINTFPSNQAAMLYENANLTCQVTGSDAGNGDNFEWQEYITSTAGVRIYGDPGGLSNPSKYDIFGKYDLRVKQLGWTDGGLYKCSLWSGDEGEASILVFDTPEVTSPAVIETHGTTLTCLVRFAGPRDLDSGDTPSVEMTVPSVGSLDVYTSMTAWAQGLPYVITAEANYTGVRADYDENVICRATTTNPSYQVTGNASLDVQFPVEAPIFAPETEFYYVGEVINCSASGNPIPIYTWTADSSPLGAGSTVNSEYLEIQPNMEGPNTWTCTATNTVQNQETTVQNTISFTVYPAVDASSGPPSGVEPWKIAVGVCVPLGVIIIVMVFVAIFVIVPKEKEKKRKKHADRYNGSVTATRGVPQTGTSFPGDGHIRPNAAYEHRDHPDGGPYDDLHEVTAPVTRAAAAPVDAPAPRPYPTKDSPGYADLGVRHINNSYPGINVNLSREQSLESLDDDETPPLQRAAPPPAESRNYRPPPPRSAPSPTDGHNYRPPSRPLPGQMGDQYYVPTHQNPGQQFV